MRLKNVLSTFIEFTFNDVYMQEQEFADYSGKYQTLNDKIKFNQQKEVVSILDEIDFELELLHRDEINVTYILKLLANLKNAKPKDKVKQQQKISDFLNTEVELRSKKELIEKFIQNNLPSIGVNEDVEVAFKKYWEVETQKALQSLTKEETLKQENIESIINDYLFTGRMATEDAIIEALEKQPSVLQRETISTRVTTKILDFVKTFINGID